MALSTVQKNKEFTALIPYITKKTAPYIRSLVYNSPWLEGYFTPNPKHYYSKDVIPNVTIKGDKITVRNAKKGHEQFAWPFISSTKFDLYKQVWTGEEEKHIVLKKSAENDGIGKIVWAKTLYHSSWVSYSDRSRYVSITYSDTQPSSRYLFAQYTKGVTSAEWVGTQNRGLVKMTHNLCELMQSLRQVENSGLAVNLAPQFVLK